MGQAELAPSWACTSLGRDGMGRAGSAGWVLRGCRDAPSPAWDPTCHGRGLEQVSVVLWDLPCGVS